MVEGMGVIVKQKIPGPGNPWWIFIHWQGKRKSIKIGDKTAAENLASKIRERLKSGELQIEHSQSVLFGEYTEKWLTIYAETNLKHSTVKGYRSVIKTHLACFNDLPLKQITRALIKDLLYSKLKAGLSPARVTRIKALISSILNHALEDGLITTNPAIRLGRLIKTKDRKADIIPLTRDEAKTLLDTIQEHYPRYYPLFLCALRTGLRLGELLALEWGDIDFNGGFIEIRRAYVEGRITTPKSGKIRRVDMSKQLAETIRILKTERKKEALAKGWDGIPPLVFTNEAGRVIDHGNLRRRVFWKALEKAGLRRIRLHDLRHTFASLLIQQGESLAYVRDQLGHHSIQVTVDTYGHLVPGANRGAVDKLDNDKTTYGEKSGCV